MVNGLKLKQNTSPSARTFANMVYDASENRILLFGGNRVLFGNDQSPPELLNDLWEFKNNQWTIIERTKSPAARAEASMIYHPKSKKIILFGGYRIVEGKYIKLSDTWEFVDNKWQFITDQGPSGRHGVVFVYDQNLDKSIMFGGSTADRQYGEDAGQTWVYENTTWSQIETTPSPGVYNSAFAYDHTMKRVIRFGGWNGKSRINRINKFQKNAWVDIRVPSVNTPEARNHSQMVYDSKNDRLILYGGHDGDHVFADMWQYKKGKWRLLHSIKPAKRVQNGH